MLWQEEQTVSAPASTEERTSVSRSGQVGTKDFTSIRQRRHVSCDGLVVRLIFRTPIFRLDILHQSSSHTGRSRSFFLRRIRECCDKASPMSESTYKGRLSFTIRFISCYGYPWGKLFSQLPRHGSRNPTWNVSKEREIFYPIFSRYRGSRKAFHGVLSGDYVFVVHAYNVSTVCDLEYGRSQHALTEA